MTWTPVTGLPSQRDKSDGTLASGYYLKFYKAGTTTAFSMATDSTGGTTLAKCQVDSNGDFINGSGDVFIPHVDQTYKAVLYTNSTDADADTTANAVWVVDNIPQVQTNSGDLWNLFSGTPTQTSATTFTLTGDQRTTFAVGTRLKFTDSSTLYGHVTAVAYTTLTTVTVTLDSGSLSGSLTEVYTSRADTASLPVGASSVSFLQAGTGAAPRSVRSKFLEWVSVTDYGATGDGATDSTTAIQNALNTGNSIYIPSGVYLVDTLSVPASMEGQKIFGDGFSLYDLTEGTVLKARSVGTHIFAPADGCNNLTIEGICFDADDKADMCIDGTYGAYLTIQRCGLFKSLTHGFKGRQGLGRFYNIYGSQHAAIGFEAYSDAVLDSIEFSGGTIPIRVVAGGNRLSNIWANGASDTCLELAPLDTATNHINTSLNGIYIGEVYAGATEKPILRILGNGARRVQDVQISNLHTVSADTSTNKINGHIYCENADQIVISSWAALGVGGFETANLYDTYALYADDATDISIDATTIKNLCRTPIYADNASSVSIGSSVRFIDWAGSQSTGDQKAAIQQLDSGSDINIADGATFANARVADSFAGAFADGSRVSIGKVNNKMSGSTRSTMFTFTANAAPWATTQFPDSGFPPTRYHYGRNVTQHGSFSSLSGGGSTSITTIDDISEEHNYLITIQQAGTGANATVGHIFANGSNVGVCTTGNTQSAPLANTFTNAGRAISVNIGTGYGATTWEWMISRIL